MKRESLIELGGTHPTIYHPFISALLPDLENKTVIDIGCGRGIWGFLIKILRSLEGSNFIGVDLNDYSINFVKAHNIYTKVIRSDITKKLPFKDKSVDFIICSEVIEHFGKRKGMALLKEFDRIAKPGARIIVTTPNVWLNMPYKNVLDRHYSLWSVKDFKDSGYSVRGIGVGSMSIHYVH
ncbi:MAG TPA: class I SAM-dependent methyltransferase [Patescibacteria group bacterium]|nr:class I SAM-dependent methyltransferase [Patescibacteria group bacterium]